MMRDKDTGKKILLILIAASLGFIWIHSLVPKEQSYTESGIILQIIQGIFGSQVSGHMVRKAAHFLEYAVLGGLLSMFAIRSGIRQRIVFVLICGGCTALLDETIQIFSGRNSQISDVLLDISGVLFAYIVVCAGKRIVHTS